MGNQGVRLYFFKETVTYTKPPVAPANILPLMKGMDLISLIESLNKRFPKLNPLVIKCIHAKEGRIMKAFVSGV